MTDLLTKVKALEEANNHKPAKRESNRERYPEIADFVDRQRVIFGEGVKVISVTEDDK